MKRSKTSIGLGVVVLAALISVRCSPESGTQTESAEPVAEASDSGVLKAEKEIDIGDITYGVYGLIRYPDWETSAPNIEVTRLTSPRFDHRVQKLTLDISPPHPESLDMQFWLGSTRPLPGHVAQIRAHVFREYVPADSTDGTTVKEEILTIDQTLGDLVATRRPIRAPFDAFEGIDALPETMLIYSELEAWLYLHTPVNDFDPENPGKEPTDYERYMGFNPARINLLDGAEAGED